MPSPHPATLPTSFMRRKAQILTQLSVPAEEYDDLSPKGSVDEGIRSLIDGVNAREGWVTTSSCAGRVCVFVEGERRLEGSSPEVRGGVVEEGLGVGGEEKGEKRVVGAEEDGGGGDDGGEGDELENGHGVEGVGLNESEGTGRVKLAGAGGKGGGGRWLFVSHEPVEMSKVKVSNFSSFLGMQRTGQVVESGRQFTEERLIHFKFEPMILHVLTASLSHAQVILKAALQAGFRESGALNLISTASEAPSPMVAVRSTGLALDCVIGRLGPHCEAISIVSDTYLEGLLAVANDRFGENTRRITRFHDLLLGSTSIPADIESGKKTRGSEWEDASVRRERKRAEGLKKSQELKEHKGEERVDS